MAEQTSLVAAGDSILVGWGQRGVPGHELRSEDLSEITRGAVLTRGLGRSYGDSSLPPPGVTEVAGSRLADRILSWDEESGILRAEAGLTIAELVRCFLPRGWVTPVSPGTKFVTLGGAVASDVHGKNHHVAGCFGEHVRALKMRLADDRTVECSMQAHPDLFLATLGGMGLTGHILEVELQMEEVPSPWIVQESIRVPNIEEYVYELKAAASEWPMTMGWVDCVSGGSRLGRGILQRGRWARAEEAPAEPPGERRKLTVPFRLPNWLVCWASARAFNGLYYATQSLHSRSGITHPDPFFYPLDAIHDWYRIYGSRGFTQYQCVLPDESSGGDVAATARRFLTLLTKRGGATPLCVIKDCGSEGRGMLSFPLRGISIAVDLWVDDRTPSLVDALNEFVIEAGGRVYLSKDTFTRREHFEAMEPRLEEWKVVRRRWDPEGRLRSAQSVRLLGDEA